MAKNAIGLIVLTVMVKMVLSAPDTTTIAPTTTTAAPATTTTPPSTTTNGPTPTTQAPYCQQQGLTCYDCRSLQFCNQQGDSQPTFQISCAQQTGNRNKYCDAKTNQCTDQYTCDSSPAALKCYKAGRRPDPLDCTKYVECIRLSGSGYTGYSVQCPEGTRYSVAKEACAAGQPCQTVLARCNANSGRIVAFPSYPSIYVVCPKTAGEPIEDVEVCKGDYQFNETAAQCQPVCSEEGTMASNEDCHKFYVCTKTGTNRYLISLNSCPYGTGFNSDTGVCDPALSQCASHGYGSIRRYF